MHPIFPFFILAIQLIAGQYVQQVRVQTPVIPANPGVAPTVYGARPTYTASQPTRVSYGQPQIGSSTTTAAYAPRGLVHSPTPTPIYGTPTPIYGSTSYVAAPSYSSSSRPTDYIAVPRHTPVSSYNTPGYGSVSSTAPGYAPIPAYKPATAAYAQAAPPSYAPSNNGNGQSTYGVMNYGPVSGYGSNYVQAPTYGSTGYGSAVSSYNPQPNGHVVVTNSKPLPVDTVNSYGYPERTYGVFVQECTTEYLPYHDQHVQPRGQSLHRPMPRHAPRVGTHYGRQQNPSRTHYGRRRNPSYRSPIHVRPDRRFRNHPRVGRRQNHNQRNNNIGPHYGIPRYGGPNNHRARLNNDHPGAYGQRSGYGRYDPDGGESDCSCGKRKRSNYNVDLSSLNHRNGGLGDRGYARYQNRDGRYGSHDGHRRNFGLDLLTDR